jgi:hydrogenase nickel incorporation protein HypB
MCTTCGCGSEEMKEPNHAHTHDPHVTLLFEQVILAENDKLAMQNRTYFTQKANLAINISSSTGSGKTSLLEATIRHLDTQTVIKVVEDDQHTELDSLRIKDAGADSYQINTGKVCHLDAHMLNHALEHLSFSDKGIIFIENVGNLICPALFDLGERFRRTFTGSISFGYGR